MGFWSIDQWRRAIGGGRRTVGGGGSYLGHVGSWVLWYLVMPLLPLLMYTLNVGAISSEVTPSPQNPSSLLELIITIAMVVVIVMSGGSGSLRRRQNSDDDTFIQRHLGNGDPLPLNLNQSSEANDHTSIMTQGLDNVIGALTKIAEGIRQYFCNADCNSTNLNNVKVLVVGHFPPDNQNIGIRGILHTWITTTFNMQTRSVEEESHNVPPQNPSIHEFFRTVSHIMSIQYGLAMDVASKVWGEITVWVDILPITLPYNSANGSGTDLYNKTR